MINAADYKVLIVDDEPDITELLSLYLGSVGFRTEMAGTGRQALEMLAADDFDLVLLDIRMPDMSGVEVLERIHALYGAMVVIMMTAHGSEELAVSCMRSGAADYFSKPFSLDDALQRVERALEHQQTLLIKQRLEQEKADFVSMLSHDMKNPITAVIGSIDIIREGRLGPVSKEQGEYLNGAIDSCNEVVAMINNLLDVNRFESGRMPLRNQLYDVGELLRDTMDRFARIAACEEVSMELRLAPELPGVMVDKGIFGRVIANLFANAIKFTPAEGTILISTSQATTADIKRPGVVPPALLERNAVRIQIKDSGYGIPANDLDHIFERFYQSPHHHGRAKGGSGLGLAFCSMAIERFNGIIWAESDGETGSEFNIMLPGYVQES